PDSLRVRFSFVGGNGRQSPSRGEQLTVGGMSVMRQPSTASGPQYAPGNFVNNTKLRMPAMQSESPKTRPLLRCTCARINPDQGVNRTGSFNLRFSTAITASVRLVTLSALRMAVT